jgi:hypothetical protein
VAGELVGAELLGAYISQWMGDPEKTTDQAMDLEGMQEAGDK